MTVAPVRVETPVRRRRHAPAGAPSGAVPGPMPGSGPLVDRFGRVHDDLRISVTDRCNLRCVYCMPETGMTFQPAGALLDIEELLGVASVARSCGVRSVRLTGGEPLLRRGVVALVEGLTEIGFEDVAMTTNGMLLERHCRRLAAAGLRRVNISCDSLDPERFAAIRRRGDLATVLRSMDAAEEAGLGPVKVNVVLMAGLNDDEVLDFAAFARRTGRTVRFIEFMPLDGDRLWSPDRVVAGGEVLAAIEAEHPLVPVAGGDPAAPAERYRFADGPGGEAGTAAGTAEIGIIRSVTRPFCGTCNRLRLTADGAVRNCLFSDDELSVVDSLRRGDVAGVEAVLRTAVWGKRAGHGTDEPGFAVSTRSMSMIGG